MNCVKCLTCKEPSHECTHARTHTRAHFKTKDLVVISITGGPDALLYIPLVPEQLAPGSQCTEHVESSC